jgi:hypothetical protein
MSFDIGGAIPGDPSIPFVWDKRVELSAKGARNIREDWRGGIRDPKDCEGTLSQPVESWCIHCTERTKLKGDRTRYVDESPRWTKGEPPKYVERRPLCLNFLAEGRPGTARFVSVDTKIPSIYKKRVSTFEKHWWNLQEGVKADVLGTEAKSSTKPRAPALPSLSRAKAPAELKSLEANVSSKQES